MKIIVPIALSILVGCNTVPVSEEPRRTFKETKIDDKTVEFSGGVRHTEHQFDDWRAVKITDPLKKKPVVVLCTSFLPDTDTEERRFCFRMYSARSALVQSYGIPGRGAWPFCEFDSIDYKIDDLSPGTMPKGPSNGGSCASGIKTDSHFFDEMISGSKMAMKLHYSRVEVSLNGFSEALEYAKEEHRPFGPKEF